MASRFLGIFNKWIRNLLEEINLGKSYVKDFLPTINDLIPEQNDLDMILIVNRKYFIKCYLCKIILNVINSITLSCSVYSNHELVCGSRFNSH